MTTPASEARHTAGVWIFGYGSLVSPESFGRTLGRPLAPGRDFFEAELAGYGRRWNYGVMHTQGVWTDPTGAEHDRTIVALGVVADAAESVNGVVGWVAAGELAPLDHRERVYDRVDVTESITTARTLPFDAPVQVYVPRAEAIEHYRSARDAGLAAVDHDYWTRVDTAFRALGGDQHARYHASTPPPDVPIVPLARR